MFINTIKDVYTVFMLSRAPQPVHHDHGHIAGAHGEAAPVVCGRAGLGRPPPPDNARTPVEHATAASRHQGNPWKIRELRSWMERWRTHESSQLLLKELYDASDARVRLRVMLESEMGNGEVSLILQVLGKVCADHERADANILLSLLVAISESRFMRETLR